MSEPPRGSSLSPSLSQEAEVELLWDLVRRRHGARLTETQADGVKKAIQGIVEGARALRAVRLSNADEPFQPFTPFRSDS